MKSNHFFSLDVNVFFHHFLFLKHLIMRYDNKQSICKGQKNFTELHGIFFF